MSMKSKSEQPLTPEQIQAILSAREEAYVKQCKAKGLKLFVVNVQGQEYRIMALNKSNAVRKVKNYLKNKV